jgi:hypothetical protein
MTKHRNPDKQYDVTYKGEYFTSKDGHQVTEPYEETIKITQGMVNKHGPLVPFVRHWAPVHMREKHKGYTGLATHYIKEAKVSGAPKEAISDPRLMNHTQMLQHIETEELPINTVLYSDDDALRQAILDWEDAVRKRDEDGFLKQQEKQLTVKKDRIDLRNDVLLLNAVDPPQAAAPNEDPEDEEEADDEEDDEEEEAAPIRQVKPVRQTTRAAAAPAPKKPATKISGANKIGAAKGKGRPTSAKSKAGI